MKASDPAIGSLPSAGSRLQKEHRTPLSTARSAGILCNVGMPAVSLRDFEGLAHARRLAAPFEHGQQIREVVGPDGMTRARPNALPARVVRHGAELLGIAEHHEPS